MYRQCEQLPPCIAVVLQDNNVLQHCILINIMGIGLYIRTNRFSVNVRVVTIGRVVQRKVSRSKYRKVTQFYVQVGQVVNSMLFVQVFLGGDYVSKPSEVEQSCAMKLLDQTRINHWCWEVNLNLGICIKVKYRSSFSQIFAYSLVCLSRERRSICTLFASVVIKVECLPSTCYLTSIRT